MSRLDELIAELCPDGVPFRPIGELCKRNKGVAITAAQMKILAEPGAPVRVFAAGNTFADVAWGAVPRASIIEVPSVIVKSRGNIDVEYVDRPFTHKSEMWSYTASSSLLDIKFLYYWLLTRIDSLQQVARATSVKLPQLSVGDTDRLRVPVPPLEVQREIVRILDQFTELEAELEAELRARSKQFEFLLNDVFDSILAEAPRARLGNFAQLVRGSGMPKSDFCEAGVGCIHYGQIYTRFGTWTSKTMTFVSPATASKLAKVDPGDLIVANTSENLADVCKAVAWLGSEEIVTGGHATVVKHSQDPKFLSFYFRSRSFDLQKRRLATGTKVIDVSARQLANVEVPLPSIHVQQRVAAALDKLDALVNDISIGLPAELAARRKQYAYYRDKLLAFRERAE